MNPSEIVIAGKMGGPAGTLDEIADALGSRGHQVIRCETLDDVRRDSGNLARTDILVATPRFVCSGTLIAGAACLRGIVSPVTGIEGVDVAAATDHAVLVANGQTTENTDSLAEATILLILAALYDLYGSETVLRQNLPRPPNPTARMLRDKTVGLIGFGQIARAMAGRLAGWQLRILACGRRMPSDLPDHVGWADIDVVLRDSDVVCVLTTLNASTEGLLSADRLRLLKPGAVLVNTARGAIIDEPALAVFARERPDVRLALDTFVTEPLPPDSPLRDLPNAILTPHMVGHTQESIAAIPATSVESVCRMLAGELPRYMCNPSVVPRWRARWATTA